MKNHHHHHHRYAPADLPAPLLRAACDAWERGGSLRLGPWAARHLAPWCARAYGELLVIIRRELNDTTDYSIEEEAIPHGNQ